MLYLPGSNQCEVTDQTPKFVNQIYIWFSKTLLNWSPRKLAVIEHQHWPFIRVYRILQLPTGKQAASPHSKWVNAPDSTCIVQSIGNFPDIEGYAPHNPIATSSLRTALNINNVLKKIVLFDTWVGIAICHWIALKNCLLVNNGHSTDRFKKQLFFLSETMSPLTSPPVRIGPWSVRGRGFESHFVLTFLVSFFSTSHLWLNSV